MSTVLFRRSWRIQIDTLDVSALDCEFKILRSTKDTPNKCVLTIWNLNPDHRGQLLKRTKPDGKAKGIPVEIEAGYVDNTSVIFSGDLREVTGQRDTTDRKLVLSGDDGGRAYREARVNQSFAAGTPVSVLLTQLASALGIGQGNASTFTTDAKILGLGSTVPGNYTMSGPAAKEMSRLLGSMGLTWSVQKGVLQVLKKGQPLNQAAILVSPSTGLIGSPESSVDATLSLGNAQQFSLANLVKAPKAKKPKEVGILKFRTLMIPGMDPGKKITMQSSEFNGGYVLTEVETEGQTWAQNWHHSCIARVY